ncbi:hypothetical protein D3C80_1984660 [compost metagenome]
MKDSQPVLLVPVNMENQGSRCKIECYRAKEQIHHQLIMKFVQEQELNRCGNCA